jgi:pyruvate/2-oxoglutarate dehydrogenase complex dihydrolipoamide dehydrogenase (E3) component
MQERFDLVIVGLGTAGIVAAEAACAMGARVAAVERARIGGDCLWTGCVPSKALLAAGRVAQTMRTASAFGIASVEPEVDFAAVMERVAAVQERIAASDDSPERMRDEIGVELLFGQARLVSPHEVAVALDGGAGERRLAARHILVATGSSPAAPPLPGLHDAGFLTSDTVWSLREAPASLVVLGGGPTGLEIAQGFGRLGVPVTVLEQGTGLLPAEEPDLAARLLTRLRDERVDVRLGVAVDRVRVEPDGTKVLEVGHDRFACSHIVVATGRTPHVEGLGLEQVGVEVGERGIVVDDAMRTSVPSIYAAGDVAGRYRFTHSAGFEGARAVRNMLFPLRDTSSYAVPWCTFTDPELAHAGLTASEARERFGPARVEVHDRPLSASDRARVDGSEDGAIRIVTHRGRVVGAHVLAERAGELIGELALAIEEETKLSALGSLIHAYPTLGTDVQLLGADAAYASAKRLRFLART